MLDVDAEYTKSHFSGNGDREERSNKVLFQSVSTQMQHCLWDKAKSISGRVRFALRTPRGSRHSCLPRGVFGRANRTRPLQPQ